jgi:hypothetical protein
MADENQGLYQVNTPCTLGHPNLLEPSAFKDPKTKKAKGDPTYSGIFVFKNGHPDLPGLKTKILEAAKAKWPDKNIVEEAKAGNIKMPFANGDKLADKRVAKLKAAGKEDDHRGDFQRGGTVFRASSKFPPGLGVVSNKAIVDITDENKALHKGAFYFGTDCFVSFTFKAYDAINEDAKAGVKAYLTMVVSLNRGKKLSSQRSSAEAFKGVAGLASMEDPTGGSELDDEIPF